MIRAVKKGFTLIELAVVIAIIAILAAVAIPRFADTTTSAELATLRDLKSQLVSSIAMWTARQGTAPTDLTTVVNANAAVAANQTLSLEAVRNRATGAAACTVAPTAVNCTLSRWTAAYAFNPADGTIRGSANAVAGVNTQPNIPLGSL